MSLNFNDFQKQDIKFDINELKKAYQEILKIKDFDGVKGVSNFGAISLTQIPGDPDSIKGHKARGVFWTKPNQSGEEVVIVQIAGLIARRIVCEVEEGQTLKQGDRIGMIRFGSRVDIYFKNKKTLAKIGQNVVSGESLIARDQ